MKPPEQNPAHFEASLATPQMVAAGIEACDGRLHARTVRRVWRAMLAAAPTATPPTTDPTKSPQYIIEGIILRRLHEKRVEGYTLEMSKEIAAALSAISGAESVHPTTATSSNHEMKDHANG